jgi:hypothetical protein
MAQLEPPSPSGSKADQPVPGGPGGPALILDAAPPWPDGSSCVPEPTVGSCTRTQAKRPTFAGRQSTRSSIRSLTWEGVFR